MFLVNVIAIDGGKYPGVEMAIMILGMAWLAAVFVMSWKLSSTTNPDVAFICKTGLHICYILFISVVFVMAVPIWVSNMVESGNIAPGDASIWTAGIIAAYMLILNVIGIIFSVCWHFAKKRKEMSELDRMKLEDM